MQLGRFGRVVVYLACTAPVILVEHPILSLLTRHISEKLSQAGAAPPPWGFLVADGVIGAAIGATTFILAGLLLPWLAATLQPRLKVRSTINLEALLDARSPALRLWVGLLNLRYSCATRVCVSLGQSSPWAR